MVSLSLKSKSPLEVAVESHAHVLLTGPTGVGKSRLAEQIHRSGPRKSGPFVSVNLASLHEGTFESELFGHEKGAFTGAERKKIGRVEMAAGGTLFLDEIGELNLKQQARLLEFLQNQTFTPLGSLQETRVNTRIIAATHRDLPVEVREGRFREDLFHRLRVVSIRLPSLFELAADFDRILHTCLEEICVEKNARICGLSEDAANELEGYAWPGNYRELRHVLEFAVLAARAATISRDDLPEWFFESKRRAAYAGDSVRNGELSQNVGMLLEQGLEIAVAQYERRALVWALQQYRGRISHTARKLHMSKTTLLRRIESHGLRSEVELGSGPEESSGATNTVGIETAKARRSPEAAENQAPRMP